MMKIILLKYAYTVNGAIITFIKNIRNIHKKGWDSNLKIICFVDLTFEAAGDDVAIDLTAEANHMWLTVQSLEKFQEHSVKMMPQYVFEWCHTFVTDWPTANNNDENLDWWQISFPYVLDHSKSM